LDPGGPVDEPLSKLLKRVASGKPLAVFFDQFEEFFQIEKGGPKKRKQFITEVATLNRDKSSGVHIVFSMREDFLYEMDQFRDHIPTIFHNDSSLRLRGLRAVQAADAIKLPAASRGVTITDGLVERLIIDLSRNSELEEVDGHAAGDEVEIDPTHLQIVCDTLWRKRANDSAWAAHGSRAITLDDYLTLGQGMRHTNPARQILNQRLAEQFEKLSNENELDLLERLLPKLRTKRRTKFVREIPGLIQELKTDETSLRTLLDKLEQWQVVRKSQREDSIELSHDYLVKSLGDLRRRVRGITPRRILRQAISKYGSRGEEMLPEELAKISKDVSVLKLDASEIEFLFRAALANEIEMKLWYSQAELAAVDVWSILNEKIESKDTVEAFYVLDLLVELKTPEAFKLLGNALGQERLKAHAVEALGHAQTLEAVQLLARQLKQPELANQAEGALKKLSRARGDKGDEISLAAKRSLEAYEESKPRPSFFRSLFTPRSSEAAASSKAPVALLADRLSKGEIIPFLGTGASLSGRQLDERWLAPRSAVLPSGTELARYLADASNFPVEDESFDLLKVAEYFAIIAGRRALEEQLHEVLDRDYPLAAVHEFLADIDAPMLIVTTNYDDLIERALKESGREHDVVIHTTDPSLGDSILWWPFGETSPTEISPNRLDVDLSQRTVVYKMNGSVDRKDRRRDQFVITEDDHIEFLTRLSRNKAIPAIFAESFQTRPFLFLGYGLRDWHVRVLLNRIFKDLRRLKGLRSWSIQYKPSNLEQILWQQREIAIYDSSLDDFIHSLRSMLG
jgi:hypothetical protein